MASLATALIGAALLMTGAAGSLAHELKPGSQTSTQSTEGSTRPPAAAPAGQAKTEMMAAKLAEKQARLADPAAAARRAQAAPGLRVSWVAVSPWTHIGDRYGLVLTNGPTPQNAMVHAMIMDHRNQLNTPVLHEEVQLAPGERRELSATNEYGDANHFHTRVVAENDSLTFQVTLTDSSGAETARYNQRAFNFLNRFAAGPRAADKQGQQMPHTHGP